MISGYAALVIVKNKCMKLLKIGEQYLVIQLMIDGGII